jgi:HD-GYP domain-containing protein (c-di-GMP phosphodiesterase class II)
MDGSHGGHRGLTAGAAEASVDALPLAVRRYIASVAAVSAVVVGLCLAFGSDPPIRSHPVLAVALAVAVLLAQAFPIHLADKTKVDVDTAALTAAALLLSPAAAAVLAATAAGILRAARREDRDQAVFNVAQTALYVGVGGLVFRALADASVPPEIPGLGTWVAVLAAIAAMHLLNTLAVAGIVALQLGHAPFRVWREDLWLDFPEHLVLVVLGVLFASLAGDRPWLLLLAVPPLALVYASLRRGAEVRAAAEAAAVATGDLLDLLTQAPRGHSRRVADWTRLLAGRVGLSAEEAAAAVRAAHLHGLALLVGGRSPRAGDPNEPGAIVGPDGRAIEAVVRARPRSARLALHVSERWDGSGMPDSLAGEEIPVGARIVAVADAFDHLVEAKAPARALDPDAALGLLMEGGGRAWDPRLVEALGNVVGDRAA